MGTKTTEAPAAIVGGEVTIGGTHGAPAIRVQVIEIGRYVFYRGVTSGALYEPCGRCDFSVNSDRRSIGHIRGFEHVAGGVCFGCGGAGYVGVKANTEDVEGLREIVRKRELAKAARERKAQREAEEARQAAAAWAEANADLAAALAAICDRVDAAHEIVARDLDIEGYPTQDAATIHRVHHILLDLARKASRAPLSAKQAAFATSLLAEQAQADERRRIADEAHAARVEAAQHLGTINEKLTVTGTVKVAVMIKVDSFRIPGAKESKMMIVLDVNGSEVKIVSDAQWAWDAERGQVLTLTGTVKRHGEHKGVAQTTLGGRIKVG